MKADAAATTLVAGLTRTVEARNHDSEQRALIVWELMDKLSPVIESADFAQEFNAASSHAGYVDGLRLHADPAHLHLLVFSQEDLKTRDVLKPETFEKLRPSELDDLLARMLDAIGSQVAPPLPEDVR